MTNTETATCCHCAAGAEHQVTDPVNLDLRDFCPTHLNAWLEQLDVRWERMRKGSSGTAERRERFEQARAQAIAERAAR
jgi:hypothetical protein